MREDLARSGPLPETREEAAQRRQWERELVTMTRRHWLWRAFGASERLAVVAPDTAEHVVEHTCSWPHGF